MRNQLAWYHMLLVKLLQEEKHKEFFTHPPIKIFVSWVGFFCEITLISIICLLFLWGNMIKTKNVCT